MKIVSAAEMREIDRVTSQRFGVSSLTLMENAGSAVARLILSEYPKTNSVSVLCGKGNNGGDGFVAARKLKEAGRAVRVLLLSAPDELRGGAASMFQRLTSPPLEVRDVRSLESSEVREILGADLIVDALLGTGFRPPVSPLYAALIEKINACPAPVVAVDIPSGADADGIEAQRGTVARANAIVTFTAPRPAHVFSALTTGPTMIAPIGSPPEAIVSHLGLYLSTAPDFKNLMAGRKRDANKGSYGHVLVIGGSLGKAGAPAMAAFAALRTGAGLSTVATPKSVLHTVAGFHPELMTEPLEETAPGTIALENLESDQLNRTIERKTVLAIGPGISRNSLTAEFVRRVVGTCPLPAIVDADGLNAFEGKAGELTSGPHPLVITPHPGEMARLTGWSVAEIQANRVDVARQFAREHKLIVVLKGHRTLIASHDGTVWVNPTGNPGMATGGTGDVLTGMVAGLIAQNPTQVFEATALAVFLHGVAGDVAREEMGENSLVATDLIRFLPSAFKRIHAEQDGELRIHT